MIRKPGRAAPALVAGLALLCASGVRCAPDAAPPAQPQPPAKIEKLVARVLAEWPHDPDAFTQGLVWEAGGFWESLGLYGRSQVRRVELESGRVLRSADCPKEVFGEGLALADGRLVQITWKEGRAFFYDPATLRPSGQTTYRGDGWGLTFDGARLWMSDGSATLQVRDPKSLALERTLSVSRSGEPQGFLNELEWADGALWANVWQSDTIVRIDPKSGEVTGEVDASGLLTREERERTDVLNGIAWDPKRRVFFVTGKLWPKLFEVEFARP